MEDAIRNSTIQIEKNKTAIEKLKEASKDKNKPDEERIELLRQAIALEKENLKIQVDLANREKKLQDDKIKQLEILQQARDEDYQAQIDAQNKVQNLIQESTRKRSELKAQESELSQKIISENLKVVLDGYANEIKLLELHGKDTTALKIQVADRERDLLLSQADPKDVANIRKNHEVKITEIQMEAGEERKKLLQEEQDIRNNLIFDGQTRELTELAVATSRKLAEIKKGLEEETLLRNAIEEEAGIQALAIKQKYAEENLEKERNLSGQSLDILVSALDNEFKALEQSLILSSQRQLQLRADQFLQGTITAEQLADEELRIKSEQDNALIDLEILRLQRELDLQLKFQNERQVLDEAFFVQQKGLLEEKLLAGTISSETFLSALSKLQDDNAKKQIDTEVGTQSTINDIVASLNNLRFQKTVETENKIVETKKKSATAQAKINSEILNNTSSAIKELSAILSADEAKRKRYGDVLKVLGIGEVVINLQKEIAGYWAGVGNDTSKTGLIGGAASIGIASLRTAIAVARASAAAGTITSQQFAEGGFTLPVDKAVAKFNPKYVDKFLGGFTNSATITPAFNMYGEKEREYVAPGWQLNEAPEVFSYLESWRRTGVRPFADGGFTSSTLSGPIFNFEAMEQSFVRAVMALPPGIITVEDINVGQARVNLRESRAGY